MVKEKFIKKKMYTVIFQMKIILLKTKKKQNKRY